jgi:hypothetical protein
MKKVIMFSKKAGYGEELSNPNNWILGTGATKINENEIDVVNSPNSTFVLLENIDAKDGVPYKIEFEIYDFSQGALRVAQPYVSDSGNSNGKYIFEAIKSSGNWLGLRTSGVTTLKIKNISVKEVL